MVGEAQYCVRYLETGKTAEEQEERQSSTPGAPSRIHQSKRFLSPGPPPLSRSPWTGDDKVLRMRTQERTCQNYGRNTWQQAAKK